MQIYSADSRSLFRKERAFSKKKILIFSVLLLVFLVASILHFRNVPIISPVDRQSQPYTANVKAATTKAKNPEELRLKILNALDNSIPQYSIIVDDFLSPLKVTLGDQSSYVGASIHKIPILVSIYKEVQDGHINLDQPVRYEESDRQDYGTGTLRYADSGDTYTVHKLLEIMMKKSDNTAAYILARNVTNTREIQTIINKYGLTQTTMEDNMTTNHDMNLILKLLFTGRLFNSNLTRDAISLFLGSDFEDRLPALLPNNARVYHKIGTAIAGLHDVGVVVTPNSMYYIGIFTRGVSDEDRATQAIARISRAVYDFMEE